MGRLSCAWKRSVEGILAVRGSLFVVGGGGSSSDETASLLPEEEDGVDDNNDEGVKATV